MLEPGSPEAAGLDPARLEHAYQRLQAWAEDGSVPGAALAVARNGTLVDPRGFGVRRSNDTAEHIIKIMRHAARQSADGLHLLGVPKLFFQGVFFGHIAENKHTGSGRLPGAINPLFIRLFVPAKKTAATGVLI